MPANSYDMSEEPLLGQAPDNRCCGGRLSRRACISCAVAAAIVLAVALCAVVLFAGVVPTDVHRSINDSTITLNSINLSNPTSNSVTLDAKGMILSNYSGKAKLHATTLNIYFGGQKLGSVPMQEMVLHADTPLSLSGKLQFTDLDAFSNFAANLISEAELSLTFKADLTITPYYGRWPLPPLHNVKLDKTTQLEGMAGLHQLDLSGFDITDSTATDVVINAAATIQNPSSVSLHSIGELSFELLYKRCIVGYVSSGSSLTALTRGSNTMHLSGSLHSSNSSVTNELMERFLQGAQSNIEVRIVSSSMAIYSNGVAGTFLSTVLPGTKKRLIESMTLDTIELRPINNLHVQVLSNASVFINPALLGEQTMFNVHSVGFDCDLLWKFGPAWRVLGRMHVPPAQTLKALTGQGFKVHMNANVNTTESSMEFAEFFKVFSVLSDPVPLRLQGSASVAAEMSIGEFEFNALPADVQTPLHGLDGPTCNVSNFHVKDTEISLNFQVVDNPSIAHIQFGETKFALGSVGISADNVWGNFAIEHFDISYGFSSFPARDGTLLEGGGAGNPALSQLLSSAVTANATPQLSVKVVDITDGRSASWFYNTVLQWEWIVELGGVSTVPRLGFAAVPTFLVARDGSILLSLMVATELDVPSWMQMQLEFPRLNGTMSVAMGELSSSSKFDGIGRSSSGPVHTDNALTYSMEFELSSLLIGLSTSDLFEFLLNTNETAVDVEMTAIFGASCRVGLLDLDVDERLFASMPVLGYQQTDAFIWAASVKADTITIISSASSTLQLSVLVRTSDVLSSSVALTLGSVHAPIYTTDADGQADAALQYEDLRLGSGMPVELAATVSLSNDMDGTALLGALMSTADSVQISSPLLEGRVNTTIALTLSHTPPLVQRLTAITNLSDPTVIAAIRAGNRTDIDVELRVCNPFHTIKLGVNGTGPIKFMLNANVLMSVLSFDVLMDLRAGSCVDQRTSARVNDRHSPDWDEVSATIDSGALELSLAATTFDLLLDKAEFGINYEPSSNIIMVLAQ